jgi:hypothetical protein
MDAMALSLRPAAPFVIAALLLAVATGCTPEPTPVETDTGPNPSGDATVPPVTTPTGEPQSTPIDLSCDDLVSPDVLYIYNPNFSVVADYEPLDGTAGASALSYEGVACRWQNQTSGENIDLSVAHLDSDSVVALKNSAFAESEPVGTYGDEAYFSIISGIGTAVVFQGDYWLVTQSAIFIEPGEAVEIVDSALAALPAG